MDRIGAIQCMLLSTLELALLKISGKLEPDVVDTDEIESVLYK